MAYRQAANRRKRLLKTYNKIKGMRKHYTASGVWIDEDRGFYYKYTASNTPGYTKLLKRISNKKVRKANIVGSHGEYRRCFDYKWTLLWYCLTNKATLQKVVLFYIIKYVYIKNLFYK